MKPVFIALAAAALLLGACGQSHAAADPFVGTWTDSANPDMSLVITKQGNDYVAVSRKPGQPELRIVFSRNGNRLSTSQVPQGFISEPIADLDVASGHLHFSPFGSSVVLSRTSPAPSP
jgi:hypothetical protein